jgi:hypothetical protein
MDRHKQLHWMRDILDHLRHCYEQWVVADVTSERYLAESMKRDLDEFRRLCDSLCAASQQRRTVQAA